MNHVLRHLFTIAALTALLASCGTFGENFDHTGVSQIKNNVTTQTDILDLFGIAFKEGMENGHPMWTYQFDKYSAFGETQSKDLVILFDDRHIVKAHRYTSNMNE